MITFYNYWKTQEGKDWTRLFAVGARHETHEDHTILGFYINFMNFGIGVYVQL